MSATLQQVSLDAKLVAESVAKLLELEEMLVEFNGRQETTLSNEVFDIAVNLYKGAFGEIEYDDSEECEPVGLWMQLQDAAEHRAKKNDDVVASALEALAEQVESIADRLEAAGRDAS